MNRLKQYHNRHTQSISIFLCGLGLFLHFIIPVFGCLPARAQNQPVPEKDFFAEWYAEEGKTMNYSDTIPESARLSIQKALDRMLVDYTDSIPDPALLQERFPLVGSFFHNWIDVTNKNVTFRAFSEKISGLSRTFYKQYEAGSLSVTKMAEWEKELSFWLGDLIRTTAVYSPEVLYCMEKAREKDVNLSLRARSFHRLLTGMQGNLKYREYDCTYFSRLHVLLGAELGLHPATITIGKALKDRNGNPLDVSVSLNGQWQTVGHVFNLISPADGSRYYLDQGIILDEQNQFTSIEIYDANSQKITVGRTYDPKWSELSNAFGQSIIDMEFSYRLDRALDQIDMLIDKYSNQYIFSSKQARDLKALYEDYREQVKASHSEKVRDFFTDQTQVHVQAVLRTLEDQIKQLDQNIVSLSERETEIQNAQITNKALITFNSFATEQNTIIRQHYKNVPVLKQKMKELIGKIETYRDSLGPSFRAIRYKSANGSMQTGDSIIVHFDYLIRQCASFVDLDDRTNLTF
ncbi:MAG TPA: hypothetical protein PLK12_12485 [Prolixibacteraceae bacterium]|nr:hypothetical protein [Prolixibacteraceae bacterium]